MPTLTLCGRPNPKQEAFFMAQVKHLAYGGSRYGGKSWAMRRKFILLALNYPGINILLLRRTLPELRENHLIPMLAELGGVAHYRAEEKAFLFPNRSRIKLGYCDAETDAIQYQGQSYDVVGFEEATNFTESQWNFIKLCCRTSETITVPFRPRCYYTANPGGVGHAWFKKIFIDRCFERGENPDDYQFIKATIYDNQIVLDRNPEYLAELDSLPKDLRRAYKDGDWDVFAGQYFTCWRRDIHIIEPIAIPEGWRRVRCLDYGLDMTACFWAVIDYSGRIYVYRELYKPELTLKQAAEMIREWTHDERISYTVASPDLWSRRQETKVTGEEIMRQAGLSGLQKANDERIPGWRVLREYLEPFVDPNTNEKIAKLQFFPNCINTARTIPQLQHDQHTPEDVADTPHEVTHCGEALRYLVMSRPPVPITEQQQRASKKRIQDYRRNSDPITGY